MLTIEGFVADFTRSFYEKMGHSSVSYQFSVKEKKSHIRGFRTTVHTGGSKGSGTGSSTSGLCFAASHALFPKQLSNRTS